MLYRHALCCTCEQLKICHFSDKGVRCFLMTISLDIFVHLLNAFEDKSQIASSYILRVMYCFPTVPSFFSTKEDGIVVQFYSLASVIWSDYVSKSSALLTDQCRSHDVVLPFPISFGSNVNCLICFECVEANELLAILL